MGTAAKEKAAGTSRAIHRQLWIEELEARITPTVYFVDINATGANDGGADCSGPPRDIGAGAAVRPQVKGA